MSDCCQCSRARTVGTPRWRPAVVRPTDDDRIAEDTHAQLVLDDRVAQVQLAPGPEDPLAELVPRQPLDLRPGHRLVDERALHHSRGRYMP